MSPRLLPKLLVFVIGFDIGAILHNHYTPTPMPMPTITLRSPEDRAWEGYMLRKLRQWDQERWDDDNPRVTHHTI